MYRKLKRCTCLSSQKTGLPTVYKTGPKKEIFNNQHQVMVEFIGSVTFTDVCVPDTLLHPLPMVADLRHFIFSCHNEITKAK